VTGKWQNGRGRIFLLLVIAAVPCLLCSGMAAAIVGTAFGFTVLGIILTLYFVIAVVGCVTWLAIGRLRTRPEEQADGMKENEPGKPDAAAIQPRK
jgi:predicted permease